MHAKDKMWKKENNKMQSHTNHMEHRKNKIQSHKNHMKHTISYGKHLREKNQLEGEDALLSFVPKSNNVSRKDKVVSMELLETCD